jgi:hypothetical protein
VLAWVVRFRSGRCRCRRSGSAISRARPTARAALAQIELATTTETADALIDDHKFCYPPENPGTVLEALHPDRLGEDLLALSTPGHPHAYDSDDWAITAPGALLTADGESPPWTPNAVTVLVETARRWPHIATNVLSPRLRQHPELAIVAGGVKRSPA